MPLGLDIQGLPTSYRVLVLQPPWRHYLHKRPAKQDTARATEPDVHSDGTGQQQLTAVIRARRSGFAPARELIRGPLGIKSRGSWLQASSRADDFVANVSGTAAGEQQSDAIVFPLQFESVSESGCCRSLLWVRGNSICEAVPVRSILSSRR